MKLGVIARADDTGLGVQTREFVRHMNPDKVMVIDLTKANASMGKETTMHPEWYEDIWQIAPFPLSGHVIAEFVKDLDIIFTVECPYNHRLYDAAHAVGCKVVKQPNYEFLELLRNPKLPHPDLLIPPVDWNVEKMSRLGIPTKVLACPIATDRFKPEVKKKAKKFLHLAGHKTYMDRNGTEIVKKAKELVKSNVTIDIKENVEPCEYWELYEGYDVLLIPRHYGGLCLQVQEARAAGMVTVVGKHDPYADVGVSVKSVRGSDLTIREVLKLETYDVSAKDLAETIDNLSKMDITDLSKKSIQWAESHSWDIMKEKYKQTFQDVISNNPGVASQ